MERRRPRNYSSNGLGNARSVDLVNQIEFQNGSEPKGTTFNSPNGGQIIYEIKPHHRRYTIMDIDIEETKNNIKSDPLLSRLSCSDALNTVLQIDEETHIMSNYEILFDNRKVRNPISVSKIISRTNNRTNDEENDGAGPSTPRSTIVASDIPSTLPLKNIPVFSNHVTSNANGGIITEHDLSVINAGFMPSRAEVDDDVNDHPLSYCGVLCKSFPWAKRILSSVALSDLELAHVNLWSFANTCSLYSIDPEVCFQRVFDRWGRSTITRMHTDNDDLMLIIREM